jgi:hypothetical protein
MGKFQYEYKDSTLELESIRMYGSTLEAEIRIITGKDNDQWVFVSPSLNVSGYGNSIEEAKESFTHNVEVFMGDLFKLGVNDRMKYIKSLGWIKDKFFDRRYSKVFVDSDGILQNLEMSKQTSLVASY